MLKVKDRCKMKYHRSLFVFLAYAWFFALCNVLMAQTEWDEQGEFNTSETPHKLTFSCNGEINATDTLYSYSFNQLGYGDELVTYKRLDSESDSAQISIVLQYSNLQDDAGDDLWTNLLTIVTDDTLEVQNYIADTVSIRPDKLRLMVFGGSDNAKDTDTKFYFRVEAKREWHL
jgi:hypothetical protein